MYSKLREAFEFMNVDFLRNFSVRGLTAVASTAVTATAVVLTAVASTAVASTNRTAWCGHETGLLPGSFLHIRFPTLLPHQNLLHPSTIQYYFCKPISPGNLARRLGGPLCAS